MVLRAMIYQGFILTSPNEFYLLVSAIGNPIGTILNT